MDDQQPGVETIQPVDLEWYAAVLAVNADRAALGLPALPYTDDFLTEFGVLGRIKDWVKGQITNPEFEKKIKRGIGGRFARKFRGDLDLEDAVDKTPRIHLDAVNARQVGKGKHLKPGRPEGSPTTKLTRIDIAKSRKELRGAGFTDQQIARWEGRGAIYRADTGTDIPPVYTFIASPKAMIEAGSAIQRNAVEKKKAKIQEIEKNIKKNGGTPEEHQELAHARNELAELRNELESRVQQLEKAYQMGRDDDVSAWDEDVSAEMAAILAESIRKSYPEHLKKPGNKGFIVELDEAQLIKTVAGNKESETKTKNPAERYQGLFIDGINNGHTDRGNIINIDRNVARMPRQAGIYPSFLAPSGAETLGQDIMRHEPGHGADMRNSPWESRQPQFKSFIEATRKLFHHQYMKNNQREWFAEMYKVANTGAGNPQQQLAARAFRNMFMLGTGTQRPTTPPANWVNLNEQWLQKALQAQAAGNPIPPLPNPDFSNAFRRKLPKLPGLN